MKQAHTASIDTIQNYKNTCKLYCVKPEQTIAIKTDAVECISLLQGKNKDFLKRTTKKSRQTLDPSYFAKRSCSWGTLL